MRRNGIRLVAGRLRIVHSHGAISFRVTNRGRIAVEEPEEKASRPRRWVGPREMTNQCKMKTEPSFVSHKANLASPSWTAPQISFPNAGRA